MGLQKPATLWQQPSDQIKQQEVTITRHPQAQFIQSRKQVASKQIHHQRGGSLSTLIASDDDGEGRPCYPKPPKNSRGSSPRTDFLMGSHWKGNSGSDTYRSVNHTYDSLSGVFNDLDDTENEIHDAGGKKVQHKLVAKTNEEFI